MMTDDATTPSSMFQWFGTGHDLLEAKLAAIAAATTRVCMETYIYKDEAIGQRFREALIQAGRRGVKVKLLVDAVGGGDLPATYFAELQAIAGCEMRWFNEMSLASWSFRDHRKLLVIDSTTTFVGGCNIGEHYHGNGLTEGWRDGGLRIHDATLAEEMEREFHAQFAASDMKQWRVQVKRVAKKTTRKAKALSSLQALLPGTAPAKASEVAPESGPDMKPLFVHPGFGQSPLRDAVRKDLANAKDIAITSAYFLPSDGLRRQLGAAVARGARLRLLLGGQSDVRLMQLASQSLYPKLLDADIEVWEYQPQILHAKMLVIDNAVYVGSSNLDPRSLRINFEVMVRIADEALAKIAWAQFEADLQHSQRVTPDMCWRHGWWTKLKQRFARWLLASGDPRLAEGMLRRLQGGR